MIFNDVKTQKEYYFMVSSKGFTVMRKDKEIKTFKSECEARDYIKELE